jgi:hypothetical protein
MNWFIDFFYKLFSDLPCGRKAKNEYSRPSEKTVGLLFISVFQNFWHLGRYYFRPFWIQESNICDIQNCITACVPLHGQ